MAPDKHTMILSFCNRVLFYIYISIDGVLLTLVLLDLPLGKAELFLGPFEVLLQYGDLRSQCGGRQQRGLHMHIDILILDSCDII